VVTYGENWNFAKKEKMGDEKHQKWKKAFAEI